MSHTIYFKETHGNKMPYDVAAISNVTLAVSYDFGMNGAVRVTQVACTRKQDLLISKLVKEAMSFILWYMPSR